MEALDVQNYKANLIVKSVGAAKGPKEMATKYNKVLMDMHFVIRVTLAILVG